MSNTSMFTESWRTITTLRYAAVTLLAVLVIVMAYGLYYYPAAPIRYLDGQYVDKRGLIHSRADFERFRAWERVLVVSWAASMVSAVAHQYAKRRGP